jgi:hypothetical protein
MNSQNYCCWEKEYNEVQSERHLRFAVELWTFLLYWYRARRIGRSLVCFSHCRWWKWIENPTRSSFSTSKKQEGKKARTPRNCQAIALGGRNMVLEINEPYVIDTYGIFYFIGIKEKGLHNSPSVHFERLCRGQGIEFGIELYKELLRTNKIRKATPDELAKTFLSS